MLSNEKAVGASPRPAVSEDIFVKISASILKQREIKNLLLEDGLERVSLSNEKA